MCLTPGKLLFRSPLQLNYLILLYEKEVMMGDLSTLKTADSTKSKTRMFQYPTPIACSNDKVENIVASSSTAVPLRNID